MDISVNQIMDDIRTGVMDDYRMMDLFIGRDEDDKPYYAYVALLPSTYMEYRAKLEDGEAVDLEAYGEILYEGSSTLPPPEIQNKMTARGFQHNFEASVHTALENGAAQ